MIAGTARSMGITVTGDSPLKKKGKIQRKQKKPLQN
jgi:hypothetical protein